MAARDEGHGAAAQQRAARCDVGSGRQHAAGGGHTQHTAAGRGSVRQATVVGGGRWLQRSAGQRELWAHGEGGHGGGERKA